MKAVTLVLLWVVGSLTAIGIAWSGVGVLDDDLVAPAPAVISTDGQVGLVSESVDPFGDGATSPPASDESTPATAVAGADPGESVDDQRATSSTVGTRSTATSTTGTTARSETTGSTATSATAAPSSTASTTSAGSGSSSNQTTTTVGSEPGQYETKTFTLIGGTTSIQFSPSGTKMLWANPNPGYEVRVEPESGAVKVEFRSDDHRSRIDAWWDNGPRHDIREED